MGEWRRSYGRLCLLLSVMLIAGGPMRFAGAQQATPPAYPPSNFELRLQEHQARKAERKALLAQRTETRLQKLTGSGTAAGADAATVAPAGSLDLALPVKMFIAAVIAAAAVNALGDDAADDGAGASSVSSPVSTN